MEQEKITHPDQVQSAVPIEKKSGFSKFMKGLGTELIDAMAFGVGIIILLFIQNDETGQKIIDMFNGDQSFITITFFAAFVIMSGIISIPIAWVIKKLLALLWRLICSTKKALVKAWK